MRALTCHRQGAPGLRVVCEHITTKEGAQFVIDAGPNVAATVTPQHLLVNRNAMLVRRHRTAAAARNLNPTTVAAQLT